MSNPTLGLHHAGLTVPDLRATRAFFEEALAFEVVGEKPDYPAVFLSDGTIMITLWQADANARAFDRRGNVGLHHLAFRVADLDAVHDRLRARADVTLEFAPEALGGGATRHLMCAVPGGIRVEFIQPAA